MNKNKNWRYWIGALVIGLAFQLGNCKAFAADSAILLVAHSRQEAKTAAAIEKSMQDAFGETWLVQTSYLDNEPLLQESVNRLAQRGVKTLLLQPLSVLADDADAACQRVVSEETAGARFERVAAGRALIVAASQTVARDDYWTMTFLLESEFPRLQCCNALLLVGKFETPEQQQQGKILQQRIEAAGFANIYVCAVRQSAQLEQAIGKLAKKNLKKVTLLPLSVALTDGSSPTAVSRDELEAVGEVVKRAGRKAEIDRQGLGERFNMQQLFVQHLRDALQVESAKPTAENRTAQELDAAAAVEKWRARAIVLIDVRTPEEFAQDHVDGAVSIPLSELTARCNEIDRRRSIVLVCSGGKRSALANLLLQQRGYDNTQSLRGGLASWNEQCVKSGLPQVRLQDSTQ